MHKIIIFISLIAMTCAGILDTQKKNDELFKYSPNDIYTLPEDVDDDKPPTHFNGEIMKAKTELFENINNGKKFKLQIKTQNGIEVQQVGKLKDSKTFVVSGQYSFTGADGKRYKTRYTADEFGYHPKTELDLDIPDAFQAAPVKQNPFKFLNQNLRNPDFFSKPQTASIINTNLQVPAPTPLIEPAGPLRGSGQSGDDYSFQGQDDPNYNNQNGQNEDNYSLQNENQNLNQDQDQENVDQRLNGYVYAPPTRHYLPPALDETQYNVPSFI